jgi:hypothetical protein
MTVQVNTVVTRDAVAELRPGARIVSRSGASVWEVFFLGARASRNGNP